MCFLNDFSKGFVSKKFCKRNGVGFFQEGVVSFYCQKGRLIFYYKVHGFLLEEKGWVKKRGCFGLTKSSFFFFFEKWCFF